MSLNKAILSGKEHRRPYRGSKSIDKSCRNHGGCTWCLENRRHKDMKKIEKMIDRMNEFLYNEDTERGNE